MSKPIRIDENSRVPKYRQIVDAIVNNIATGEMEINQKLPSINSFSEEYLLSRDTVEKAYHILKGCKVITPIQGKGYYVSRKPVISKLNILFLINKLSAPKACIYNAFINAIGHNSHTDLHIYHCEPSIFLNLLEKNRNIYDYYMIMPHFKTEDGRHISYTDEVIEAINTIPKEKLILLDNNKLEIKGDIVQIYQDFENDIYNALKEGLDKITSYGKLILVYPEKAIYPQPRRILRGFQKFCGEYDMPFEILDRVFEDIVIKKGDLFITLEENDLVYLVKLIRENNYSLGKEIGVISCNDTSLKELLGITVISTDFRAMGETASRMILNNEKGIVKNPFRFIDRNSI